MLKQLSEIGRGALALLAVTCTLCCGSECLAQEGATFHIATTRSGTFQYGSFTADGAIQDSGSLVTEYPAAGTELLVMTGEAGVLEVLLYNRETYGDWITADFEITGVAGAWTGLTGSGTASRFVNYEGSWGPTEFLDYYGELDAVSPPPANVFQISTDQWIDFQTGEKSGTFSSVGAIEDSGWVDTINQEPELGMETLVMTGQSGTLEVLLFNRQTISYWSGDEISADFMITGGTGAWAGLSGGGIVSGFLDPWNGYETLDFFGELDDSPPPPPSLPELSIADVSMAEGRRGTTYADFTVSLSSASAETVTVDYATFDGTATVSNKDYREAFGVLTFQPGDTTATISVEVRGDRKREPDETFFVYLANPDGATISDDEGIGTILNDD